MKNKRAIILPSICAYMICVVVTLIICLPADEDKTIELTIEPIEEPYPIANNAPLAFCPSIIQNNAYFAEHAIYVEYKPATVTEESKIPDYIIDCPLSVEQQTYIYNACQENDLDFLLVMALIEHESAYTIDVVSETDDYGLMQINKCNHKDNLDYLDFETNVDEGTAILSSLVHNYDTLHMALMAYNMGPSGASECWEQGLYTSEYSREIMDIYDRMKSTEKKDI